MAPPRVFVSYSHDSDEHKIWVLRLATDLRERYGIDIILDHWDVDLGADLPKFMEGILKTDRVLMLCTDTYTRKCNDAEAGGVYIEKRLMSADLLRGRSPLTFIPVLRNNPGAILPDFLGGPRYVDFREDTKYSESLWELAASIHGARTKKPPLGRNPFEKGLDAGFGNNGISILRGLNVRGYRLASEDDYLYVTGTYGSSCCVVRIASNGQVDDTFG